MNKEEILARSRKENQQGDERAKLIEREANENAFGFAGHFATKYKYTKKKEWLFGLVCGILGSITCIIPLSSNGKYCGKRDGMVFIMDEELILKNHLKEVRAEKKLSQSALAELVGVSRNTISSIETGQFNPTAKLALILCIALDKKFEDLFYF